MNKTTYEQLREQLRLQLAMQTKEWLVERLCEFFFEDDLNADRVQSFLAAQADNESDVIADFKNKIDKIIKQIEKHGPADWKSRLPTRGLYNIAEALADVSLRGKPAAVLEISEYALVKIDFISGLQDECELDGVIEVFRQLHVEAYSRLNLDPEHFGRHLAELANQSKWWIFRGPPTGNYPPAAYEECLGVTGLSAYVAALKG